VVQTQSQGPVWTQTGLVQRTRPLPYATYVFQHAIHNTRLNIWEELLPTFAKVLHVRGCFEGHCFESVDGTRFTTFMLMNGEESMYNGWKRQHKVTYLCVVLSNFLRCSWFDPTNRRAHNSQVLVDWKVVPIFKRCEYEWMCHSTSMVILYTLSTICFCVRPRGGCHTRWRSAQCSCPTTRKA